MLICVTALALHSTPITEYKPRTDEEHALADLFIQYITARNNRDVDLFLATLHPECRYMIHKDLVVAKERLRAMLPGLWMQNDEDTMAFGHCMAWECWNENYYRTGMLINPRFHIADRMANVRFHFVAGLFRDENFFQAVKENDIWLIKSFSRPMY